MLFYQVFDVVLYFGGELSGILVENVCGEEGSI